MDPVEIKAANPTIVEAPAKPEDFKNMEFLKETVEQAHMFAASVEFLATNCSGDVTKVINAISPVVSTLVESIVGTPTIKSANVRFYAMQLKKAYIAAGKDVSMITCLAEAEILMKYEQK